MRLASAVIALGVLAAMPALGGQSGAVVDLWSTPNALPPADSGKPMIFTPPAVVPRLEHDPVRPKRNLR